jgi:hypothetical protein
MASKAGIKLALLSGVLAALGVVPAAATAAAPTLVTNDNDGETSYLRYDGTSDATTIACSSGRRSQNEPTVAVNPRNPDIVVAGSNDCAQIVNDDLWAGLLALDRRRSPLDEQPRSRLPGRYVHGRDRIACTRRLLRCR